MELVRLDKQTVEIIVLVSRYFVGSDEERFDKTAEWIKVKNLNFGGCSAIDLINAGKGEKVLQFVKAAMGEDV